MFFKSRQSNALIDLCIEAVVAEFELPQAVAEQCCKAQGEQVNITLPFAAQSVWPSLLKRISDAGGNVDRVNLSTDIPRYQSKGAAIGNVHNVIAVASGKGGVGKSATAINLAYALLQEGARVGILDADIYGPSVPIMLGNPDDHPRSDDQKTMYPMEIDGLMANSIGYLVPADNATIWRGPMASRALQQLVNDTLWPELDYLIVDMPPGTGDIQLTLAQQVPVTGAVVVTTPQDLALADAIKGIAMFNKVEVPVLGLIENMSYHICENCGHQSHIFNQGGGEALAGEFDVPLLAQLPLDISIRQHADGGKPLLVNAPDSDIAATYRQAARKLGQQMAVSEQLSEDNRIPVVQAP